MDGDVYSGLSVLLAYRRCRSFQAPPEPGPDNSLAHFFLEMGSSAATAISDAACIAWADRLAELGDDSYAQATREFISESPIRRTLAVVAAHLGEPGSVSAGGTPVDAPAATLDELQSIPEVTPDIADRFLGCTDTDGCSMGAECELYKIRGGRGAAPTAVSGGVVLPPFFPRAADPPSVEAAPCYLCAQRIFCETVSALAERGLVLRRDTKSLQPFQHAIGPGGYRPDATMPTGSASRENAAAGAIAPFVAYRRENYAFKDNRVVEAPAIRFRMER